MEGADEGAGARCLAGTVCIGKNRKTAVAIFFQGGGGKEKEKKKRKKEKKNPRDQRAADDGRWTRCCFPDVVVSVRVQAASAGSGPCRKIGDCTRIRDCWQWNYVGGCSTLIKQAEFATHEICQVRFTFSHAPGMFTYK